MNKPQIRQLTKNKSSGGRFAGFTIIELLVAISIIGAIVAILMPNLLGSRERARDAKKKADMNAMKTGLRMYYNDHQSYPPDLTTWTAVLPTYMPQAVNIGPSYYEYYETQEGDGFQLCVTLEADVTGEVGDSQTRCSVPHPVTGDPIACGVGITTEDNINKYVVCAN